MNSSVKDLFFPRSRLLFGIELDRLFFLFFQSTLAKVMLITFLSLFIVEFFLIKKIIKYSYAKSFSVYAAITLCAGFSLFILERLMQLTIIFYPTPTLVQHAGLFPGPYSLVWTLLKIAFYNVTQIYSLNFILKHFSCKTLFKRLFFVNIIYAFVFFIIVLSTISSYG